MAFELKQCLVEAQNSTQVSFYDSTGVYNAVTNPTGYGAPNVASSAITSAEIRFTFDLIANPILVNFVIASNVVTSATKTDQLGNVTSLDLTEFNISAFPFPQNSPIVFPASFFIGSATVIEDQYVQVDYTISDGSVEYDSNVVYLLNQNACCCLQKAWYKYSIGQCQKQQPMEIQNALNGLNAATAIADYVTGRKSLKRLKKLCCDCGCGCGGC